jgi:hypothetical protein
MATTSVGRTTVRPVFPYRLSIETAGLLTVLIGAWGAIVAFVGPLFSFSADGSSAWTWNLAHGVLYLLPGAVACVAGLSIMAAALSPRRTFLRIGGFVAALCGAWFIVGSFAWPVLEGVTIFKGASPLREFAYWIGYALGTGGLLLALGAFIVGRPRMVVSEIIHDDVQ